MDFLFHHRKLLNDDPPANCEYFCTKSNGTCPLSCSAFCPTVCKSSLLSLPPLPPPPPPPYPMLPPSASAPPDIDKPRQLSLLLILSLAVLATAFFLFTCYTIYKFYTVWRSSSRRRRQLSQRRNPEEEDGDDFLDEDIVDHPIWYIRTIGLQQSQINAITIIKYKSTDGLVEGTDCAVCLSEFEEDEALRLLPKCNHAFHISCIDTWLGSHTNCPMCRAGIVSNAGGPLPSQDPVARDLEEGRSESVRVEIQDHGAAGSQSRLEMNENVEEGDCKVDLAGLQPVRRSVSMDSLSASMISAAAVNATDKNSEAQLVIGKESRVEDGAKRVGVNGSLIRLVGSPAIERYMQSGSSSIKRSASCIAKVVTSRHSNSRIETEMNS